MQEVITVRTMRESDAYTIEHYIPSKELMYRAAMGVYRAVNWKRGTIGILTGAGNNGGDGYALACILAEQNIPCCVYRVSEKFSADGQHYHDLAREKGVVMQSFTENTDLTGYDILVDCMLGTGFSGDVRGLYRAAIQAVNAARAYVVSVDINSGLNGDTGKAELAVRSNLTVTIGVLKAGFYLGDADRYIGTLAVADIGIRLIRDDYWLAPAEDVVFPNTGWALDGDRVDVLTPGEAEDQRKNGQTIPELAVELALKEQRVIRVLGKNPLVTDGYRTYFIENGALPQIIRSLGE